MLGSKCGIYGVYRRNLFVKLTALPPSRARVLLKVGIYEPEIIDRPARTTHRRQVQPVLIFGMQMKFSTRPSNTTISPFLPASHPSINASSMSSMSPPRASRRLYANVLKKILIPRATMSHRFPVCVATRPKFVGK